MTGRRSCRSSPSAWRPGLSMARGVAFGIISSTLLASIVGLVASRASAAAHLVERFSPGASGAGQVPLGDCDRKLFARIASPGVMGGAAGALWQNEARFDDTNGITDAGPGPTHGRRTLSSDTAMTFPTPAATPGTGSAASHGASCPRDCANGFVRDRQRDEVRAVPFRIICRARCPPGVPAASGLRSRRLRAIVGLVGMGRGFRWVVAASALRLSSSDTGSR